MVKNLHLMRVIIIDDEQPSVDLIKLIIGKNEKLDIVGTYTNPTEALAEIRNTSPDAIFADIEMPQMNGIELGAQVMDFNPDIQIVFVTAYDQYALKAFEVDASNYILKPITKEALDITVDRLLRNQDNKRREIHTEKKINEIVVMGEYTVYGNIKDEKTPWATAKAKELFGYFVVNRDREIDKWELCDVLYPDSEDKKALHNLHTTISRVKLGLREVGINDIITCTKGKYIFDLGSFTCDLWEWMDFIKNNPLITDENSSDYRKVIKLYRGELFRGEDYIWSSGEKEEVQRIHLITLKKMSSFYINKREYKQAEEHLRDYIEIEPYDEKVIELLLRTYYFAGKRLEMMELYKNSEKLLYEELGVEISDDLKNAYNKILLNP